MVRVRARVWCVRERVCARAHTDTDTLQHARIFDERQEWVKNGGFAHFESLRHTKIFRSQSTFARKRHRIQITIKCKCTNKHAHLSTKCTVHPVSRTPALRACRCACMPGNAGRSAGWMLIRRPAHLAAKGAVTWETSVCVSACACVCVCVSVYVCVTPGTLCRSSGREFLSAPRRAWTFTHKVWLVQ